MSKKILLFKGSHARPDEGTCFMEAISLEANEEWSDHPRCVSPVVGAFGRAINDALPHDRRQELVAFIGSAMGTANDGLDAKRGFMCADWAVRVATPLAFDAAGLTSEASTLRNLAPVVDAETAAYARSAAAYARSAADYAADYAARSARAAAYAAADYAARSARSAASAAYADYAARSAYAAADYAARSARSAARIYDEAIEFFGRLIKGE